MNEIIYNNRKISENSLTKKVLSVKLRDIKQGRFENNISRRFFFAVTPQNHLAELFVRQNIELELQEIVLTDGQINTVLVAGQRNFLSLNVQTNTAIQTGYSSSIIVADVRGLKHQLKILAALLCIVCEKLIADSSSRTGLDTEVGVAIFVDLVSAKSE